MIAWLKHKLNNLIAPLRNLKLEVGSIYKDYTIVEINRHYRVDREVIEVRMVKSGSER